MKLTSRVVVRSLIVMAVALASVSLLTYELVRVTGREDVDRLLRRESDQLVGGFVRALSDVTVDGPLDDPDLVGAARTALTIHPSGPQHVASITTGGSRVQATGGPDAVAALARGSTAPGQEPGSLRSIDSAAGPLRALDMAVTDATGSTIAVVTLLAPLEPSRDAATNALRRTLAAAAIALLVGGAVLVLVVRRSLRPLRELSATAADITPDTLTARVPVPETDDEVRQLATELNEMLQRLDDDDRTRRRYLAAISHEVRTPLTVAEGHLELLEREQIDPASAAATVRSELQRLHRVLDDLVDVARGVEEIDVRPGPIFLPDLFDALETRLAGSGLTDRVRLEPPLAVAFTGDQARIEQSVANLVHNAVDHNPPGTSVTITATATADSVSIAVTDDGTGIDPAILPHVREPFVTTRTTGRRRASGLGLTVVDSLTEAQHGALDLVSGPTGTVATLRYPVEPPS